MNTIPIPTPTPVWKINFQEATESDAYAFHLANYIGNGSHNQAYNSHQACSLGIVPFTNKFGNRELAKLTQVRSQ